MIDQFATAAQPWPGTELRIEKVCEVRPPDKRGRVLYGANEFVQDGKICRWLLTLPKPIKVPP
jgi:hypothetical protein